MFGTRLFDQIVRSVVIVSTVIHVHMQVGTGEVAVLSRQSQRLKRDRCLVACCGNDHVLFGDGVVQPMGDLQPRLTSR